MKSTFKGTTAPFSGPSETSDERREIFEGEHDIEKMVPEGERVVDVIFLSSFIFYLLLSLVRVTARIWCH